MIAVVALCLWWKSCGGNAAVVAVLGLNKRRLQIWCSSQGCVGGEVWLPVRSEGGKGGAKNPPDSQESSLWPEEWLRWHPHAFFTIPAEVSTNTSRGIQH